MKNVQVDQPVVVLGAGPAGLGAAYRLTQRGIPTVVVERQDHVGGMGATIRRGEYLVDYGPHTFHLKQSEVTRLYDELIGDEGVKVARDAKLWLDGRLFTFPLGAAEAVRKLPVSLSLAIARDYATARFGRAAAGKAKNFEEWGRASFGETLYDLAFGKYSEKMWGLAGSRLSAKLGRQKLTGISLRELALAALGLLNPARAAGLGLSKKTLYDAYPHQGIGEFYNRMAGRIEAAGGAIHLAATPIRFEFQNGAVTAVHAATPAGETRIPCRGVISSIPLRALGSLIAARLPAAAARAARLRYRSLCCVQIVANREQYNAAHWIYMLDERLFGNRLSEQKNLCRSCCPPDRTMLCVDITCDHGDYLWRRDDDYLIGLAIHDLRRMGLHPGTIHDAFVLRADDVYPVYTLDFEDDLDAVLAELRSLENLMSIGRQGFFLNNDMHDSIEMGFMAANLVAEGGGPPRWYELAADYVRRRLEGEVRDPHRIDDSRGGP